MKKVTINFDYTEFENSYTKHPLYIFVDNVLVHKEVLRTEADEGEPPIQYPLIYSTTLELEDNQDIILSVESDSLNENESLNAKEWGESGFDMFLNTILESMFAAVIWIKGQYHVYFAQLCYGLAKRYRLISHGDAVFDLKFCSITKQYPIAGMMYSNSADAYVEEFFRPYNLEKEYAMYKKTVLYDEIVILVCIFLVILSIILFGGSRVAGMIVFILGISSIVFPIRNLTVAKRQMKNLRKHGLEFFVNRNAGTNQEA